MPSYACESCSETVPIASYCLECGEPTRDEVVPEPTLDRERLTAHLSTIAGTTSDETISFETLRSSHEQYNRPLGDYLFEHEQPVAIHSLAKVVVDGHDDSSWAIKTRVWESGHFVVSNGRVFALIPRATDSASGSREWEADQVVSVQHSSIVTVDTDSSWRKTHLSLKTLDGFEYTIGLPDLSDAELEQVAETVEGFAEDNDSAESRAAKFVQEVDEAVATHETAEGLLREVTELFADREEDTKFDSAVAESESLDELFTALQASSQPSPPVSAPKPAVGVPKSVTIPTTVPSRSIPQRASYTLKNADTGEVGKYALAAGIGLGSFAIAAPFSTAAGMAALLAGGGLTGAYASTHPDSAVAQIDPIELALAARTGGRVWKNSSSPGGEGTGAALSALEYLAEQDFDWEYAHWLAHADFDTVRRGAELAARAADEGEELDHSPVTPLMGGAMGLAYGYVDDVEELHQLAQLLGDDFIESIELVEEDDGIDVIR